VKVRGAVLEEFDRPLVVQELDLDDPRAGEVIVHFPRAGFVVLPA